MLNQKNTLRPMMERGRPKLRPDGHEKGAAAAWAGLGGRAPAPNAAPRSRLCALA